VSDPPTETPTPPLEDKPTPTLEEKPTATPKDKTPEELIEDLLGAIDAAGLPSGTQNALESKVNAALKLLERDKPCAAANTLDALANGIEALLRSRRISEEEASDLLDQIEAINVLLREEGGCRR